MLAELVLDRRSWVSSLVGFYIDVEIGRLLFVALVLPIAFALRLNLLTWHNDRRLEPRGVRRGHLAG